jgi:hypothetical protein
MVALRSKVNKGDYSEKCLVGELGEIVFMVLSIIFGIILMDATQKR